MDNQFEVEKLDVPLVDLEEQKRLLREALSKRAPSKRDAAEEPEE